MMLCRAVLWALPAAAANPVEAISRRLNREIPVTYFIVGGVAMIAIIVACALIARFYRQRVEPEPVNRPESLFDELCQAHGLSRAERQLLSRLAQDAQGNGPAAVMAAPSLFDAASDEMLRQNRNATVNQFDHIGRLRDKLFRE
jgi:hypothetical protein